MAMTLEQKHEALAQQFKRVQSYAMDRAQAIRRVKAENRELEDTLKEVYDKIIVEHLGYTGNKCDCDPSVGIFGCTVCRVRAALNIVGG